MAIWSDSPSICTVTIRTSCDRLAVYCSTLPKGMIHCCIGASLFSQLNQNSSNIEYQASNAQKAQKLRGGIGMEILFKE